MGLYLPAARYLQIILRMSPFFLRRLIVKTTLSLPLRLSRFLLNMGTVPIGDEYKWIHKIEQNNWKGVWIVPNLNSLAEAQDAALNSDLVVLFVHGGGFCRGHSGMYMDTFQLIINHLLLEHNMRASILSLDYSLSPERPWPKALAETMEAYQYMTDTICIPSSKIIFAGDSAGANTAAITVLTIKSETNRSQPAGAALFSPWVDRTPNHPSLLCIQMIT